MAIKLAWQDEAKDITITLTTDDEDASCCTLKIADENYNYATLELTSKELETISRLINDFKYYLEDEEEVTEEVKPKSIFGWVKKLWPKKS